MTEPPLYERSPELWAAHLAEGNATQPRKRVSADALICDTAGRVLLVEPTYKPGWDTPGGMSEANEAPDQTVRRELREELGIDLRVSRLLCVDWVSPHGPWDDSLCFVFDGGVLDPDQVAHLQVSDDELARFEFCTLDDATGRLSPRTARRVAAAWDTLKHGTPPQYLVDGIPAEKAPRDTQTSATTTAKKPQRGHRWA